MLNGNDGPVFTKRPEKDRYQVRFWSDPDAYAAFTQAVAENDLVIQDVLNELMHWFTTAHLSKTLRIQSEPGGGSSGK